EFHPAYHAVMHRSVGVGLHCSTWDDSAAEAGNRHSLRAARLYMTAQIECGHICPMTMTNAATAALRHQGEIAGEWLPMIRSRKYDGAFKPPAQKAGVTLGMGMTEKQGGTDVRTNTSRADGPAEDGTYRITGHKWFLSAPMSDAFLVLAQAAGGLTAFMMPRILPDGRRNGVRLMRLKDKLGNRSNASAEVEFVDAVAFRVGDEGRGIATILEMVTLTRLDCAVASAGLMRIAVAEAINHCRHRNVFQKKLIDQPMMTRVLADLALDVAAATALSMRLARAFDRADDDPREAKFARLMTPAVKYWVTKVAPAVTYEAMESLGGNGYVEDGPLARVYREAPVNAIWEGSGNVMALDAIRAAGRDAETVEVVTEEVAAKLGAGGPTSAGVLKAAAELARSDEGSGRFFAEQLALTVAAAALADCAPAIAEPFIASRLGGRWHSTYGMLDSRFDAGGIVAALYPEN
ncbi:MAG: acyl-CoA dehydrogenase family protein, partial [Hyphomicrobiales bacterium]|nr:acyl-CoA dehydrogenase family protein [Hyphomicrobiales bacterium]